MLENAKDNINDMVNVSQLTKEVIQHLYMRKPMEYGHNSLCTTLMRL